MKKALQIVSILALTALAFLIWKRMQKPIEIEKEKKPRLVKVIEKINKKIPEKLAVVKKKKEKTYPKVITIRRPKSSLETLPEEEIAIHLQAANGDLIITSVTIVDDLIIAHGDIVVGVIKDMDKFLERAESGKPMILPLPRLWDSGEIPYLIEDNLENAAEVEAAIETINKKTNVKWIPKTDEKDFVRFTVGSINCYSPLGKVGGDQSIKLSTGCTKGSIMHEMLHTMGLLHEQNREDRDKFVRILWENIDSKNHLQFQKIINKSLNLKKHPFDFQSIMLYTQIAFSKYPGDFTIVRTDGDTYYPGREALSSGDLKKLKSLYPSP